MLSFLYLVPAFVVVVALLIIAWLRPQKREAAAIGALTAAAGASLLALVKTFLEHLATRRTVADNWLDVAGKEWLLAQDYADALPRLIGASVILFVALVGCLFLLRRARLIALAATGALLAPMVFFGRRGVGLHDRMVLEAFSHVDASHLDCGALSEAVYMAGDMDRATQYSPDARRLARQCVSAWLIVLDRGGEERHVLEIRANVYHQLHNNKSSAVIDWIASSNLLVEVDQKREVERRQQLPEFSEPYVDPCDEDPIACVRRLLAPDSGLMPSEKD